MQSQLMQSQLENTMMIQSQPSSTDPDFINFGTRAPNDPLGEFVVTKTIDATSPLLFGEGAGRSVGDTESDSQLFTFSLEMMAEPSKPSAHVTKEWDASNPLLFSGNHVAGSYNPYITVDGPESLF